MTRRPHRSGAEQALLLMRGLRGALVVAGLVGAGLGWIYGSTTVVGLALVIAGEELLETSTVIAALRRATAS